MILSCLPADLIPVRLPLLRLLAAVIGVLLMLPQADAQTTDVDLLRRSLVRIHVTVQAPDYQEPWKGGQVAGGVGSGFIIAGNRVMTNAHVVSNARMILLEREGIPTRYTARVAYVAHDCDLALLEVEDKSFFEGTRQLKFGGLPELHTTVTAFGFPLGGERMSVTRGVVSRIEFRSYSHSALDAHLAVQIDAAINPGNSGGPVIQDGEVVGVAFQGLAGGMAQNIGYMIPIPVVSRFLADIEDGTYDGYVELAISYAELVNPDYRAYLGLENDKRGVVVYDVLAVGSAAGKILPGDVLTGIDGHPILSNGQILLDGETTQLEEIVERKFHGETVVFDVLREGKPKQAKVTLKGAWPYRIYANQYDQKPEYVMFAGLVFQPMNRNLIAAHSITDTNVQYVFDFFIQDEIYQERPEVVILSSILPDEINARIRHFAHSVVDTVNGQKITSLESLAMALQMPVQTHVIEVIGRGRPIVLDAAWVRAAQQRIQERYNVSDSMYVEEETP